MLGGLKHLAGAGAVAALALTAALPLAGPAQAADTIVIGVIQPFTGAIAAYGQNTMNALNLVLKEKGDTFGGRNIEFVQLDDQCTPSNAVEAANRIIDRAVAVVGPSCSGDMAAVQPILKEAKIPHFTPAYLPTLSAQGDDYFFRATPGDGPLIRALAAYIKAQGKSKIALAYDTTGFGVGEKDAFLAALKEFGMADPVVTLSYDFSVTDFSGQIGKIQSSGADAVVVLSYENLQGLFVKQAQQLGLEIPIFCGTAAAEPEFLDIGGASANGVVSTAAYSTDDPATAEFTKAYQAAYGKTPSVVQVSAAIAMYALADIWTRQGPDVKGEALRDELKKLHLKTPAGTAAWTVNGEPADSFAILQTVQDGKVVTVKRESIKAE
jgi:branched-chain amino acid transport system substrate-binding protein